MNSISRLGVTIAGFATVLTVAGAFVVQGYMNAKDPALTPTVQASPVVDPPADPTVSLAPQTVYVNPLPTPQVIQPTRPPAPPQAAQPPVIHIIVPSYGDDDGGSDH